MFPPFKSQVARAIPFDNSTTDFVATEVQSAIVEARFDPKARASITTFFDGAIANNQWLGFSHQLPGDQVPIRLPWNCILKEVAVSWVGAAVDGQIRIFKNGTTDPANVVFTQTFANQNGGAIFTPNITWASGDVLRSRWIDQGDNPTDLGMVYFFLLT